MSSAPPSSPLRSGPSEDSGATGVAGAGGAPGRRRRVVRGVKRDRSEPSSLPSRDPDASSVPDAEPDSGEDLLGGDAHQLLREYQALDHLDKYDARNLDEGEYDAIGFDERQAAEAEIAKREATRGRMPAAFEEDTSGDDFRVRAKRRRQMEDSALPDTEGDEAVPFNLTSFTVPLHEWLRNEETKNEIARQFKYFLHSYIDVEGNNVYESVIKDMCSTNGQSLVVQYQHLSAAVPTIAIWLADHPRPILEIMDGTAMEVVKEKYPDYHMIKPSVYVRIANLPIRDSVRDLRQFHLNALIRVSGVVTRRTSIFPQLTVSYYTCSKCGTGKGPITNNMAADSSGRPANLGMCVNCQSEGPFTLNSAKTVYRNYQRITLQESPGTVPAGRVPRSKEVILLADLVDECRPGEEVEITGIYTNNFDASLNTRQGFPVFATILEANYVVQRRDAYMASEITKEDEEEIKKLAKDPNITKRIIKSIAPSIYGHEHVKLALAMSLFGGREKNIDNKHRIRGDINVMLLGDPGLAKSQFLKYVEKTAPRAVFTTGKGASAVGLTAAVHRDPTSGEWTLEGGALVLADRGTCLIDEFDKMNDADRTSIHEAMEQQSISISKAGIVTTLKARCGVIAAANPIGGRYDSSKTFTENVTLTDPIIQRFDILCVLQDIVDPVADERLANFVVSSHMKSHPSKAGGGGGGDVELGAGAGGEEDPEVIPTELLKKYIFYARARVEPTVKNINGNKVVSLYTSLRRESETSNGLPVAVRHFESMLRMAEAHARMHLRSAVTAEDEDVAIKMMLESFFQAQKFAVTRALRRQFAKYLNGGEDSNNLLLYELQHLVREAQELVLLQDKTPEKVTIDIADLEARASTLGVDASVRDFLRSQQFKEAGFTVSGGARSRTISRKLMTTLSTEP